MWNHAKIFKFSLLITQNHENCNSQKTRFTKVINRENTFKQISITTHQPLLDATLDFFSFLFLKFSFGTFGTKGTTTEERKDHPKSIINNTQSRNFFCYNLSLSIIRQKDFLLFLQSAIVSLLCKVVPPINFSNIKFTSKRLSLSHIF